MPVSLCRCFDKNSQIMVNAVRHINGLKEAELGMSLGVEIQEYKVKDVITKFFYQNSHFCFHILLHMDGGETVFFWEFTGYAA